MRQKVKHLDIQRDWLCPSGKIWKLLLVSFLILLSTSWAAEGISGKIYYDWTYDNTSEPAGYNEFSIKRLYFTYEKSIADEMKVVLATDIIEPINDNAWFSYQKYAYLQWNTSMGDLVFGLQGMNVFNIAEQNWGYRYIEKSPMDAHKFASSADLGLGFKKTFSDQIHLHLTAVNGGGYKKTETDKYKKMALQLVYGELNLQKKSGYNAGVVLSSEAFDYGVTDTTVGEAKNSSLLAIFGAYANNAVRIGGEFDQLSNNGSQITKHILAFYADYRVTKQMSLYGRYESYDPDVDSNDDGDNTIIAGLNYSPGKGFNVAPNFHYSVPESGDAGMSTFGVNFEFKF